MLEPSFILISIREGFLFIGLNVTTDPRNLFINDNREEKRQMQDKIINLQKLLDYRCLICYYNTMIKQVVVCKYNVKSMD